VSRPPRGRARPRPTTSAAPTTSSRRAAPAKASPAKTAPAKHAKTKHDKAKPRARRQQSGPGLPQLFPGRRALLGLAGVVVLGLAVYFVSSASSLFAVRELEISGVTADVAADVRAALEPVQGESLVGLDLDRLEGHVAAVPTVAGVSFDRAFPHTLRVRVVPERVVAVVRQGKVGFLVAASGRVVASIARGTAVGLPRIWTARTERLVLGEAVPPALLPAVRAVSPLRRLEFPAPVVAVRATSDELSLRLRTGLEVRLGTAVEVPLKLAVATKVIPLVSPTATYLDVSVPERPVAGSPAAASAAIAAAAATATTVTLEATTVDGAPTGETGIESQPEVETTPMAITLPSA